MNARNLLFGLCLAFWLSAAGCASWIQSMRHREDPVASRPVPWFQDRPLEFAGAPVQAGYSEADLTPSRPQWLAGYAVGRKSRAVRHMLRAQCLALEDERGEKLMVVSLDLLGLLPDFVEGVRAKVKSWPAERILFASSHTHSAPDLYGIWGEGIVVVPLASGRDKKYVAEIQENLALAIEAAAQGLLPAKIRFASGKSPEGIVRGRFGNPPPSDIGILQVSIRGETVTLLHHAIHPDVMEGRYLTPDFVHFLREHFEARTGGRLMFVNGAVGGVQPRSRRDLQAPERSKNWMRAREIGEILAGRAIEILETPIVPEHSRIEVRIARLPVDIQNSRFRLAMSLGLIPRMKDGAVDVYHVRIGSAEILTAPGELFPNLWTRIEPKLSGNPKFLFGLTNVALGYLMSREDFHSGRHEYHASMCVNPGTGGDLLAVYEKLLAEEPRR